MYTIVECIYNIYIYIFTQLDSIYIVVYIFIQ